MREKKFLILFFFVFFFNKSLTADIFIIAAINNKSITNYDIFLEIKATEILKDEVITNDVNNNIFLQDIINDKIKLLELKEVNQSNIKKAKDQINLYLKKNNKKVDKIVYDYIIQKISIKFEWNDHIVKKFSNKIEVNTFEIDDIVKSKNFSEIEKNKLLLLEKQKKINLISSTYFNDIKRKYLINYF